MWAADHVAHTRPVQRLLPALASVWHRAVAAAAAVADSSAAPLPDVRKARAGTSPQPLRCLCPVLVPDRPRATAAALAAPVIAVGPERGSACGGDAGALL